MNLETYTGGPVQTNGYILHKSDLCIVIDAPAGIANYLQGHQLKPTHLLLTHQHFDHVDDVNALQKLGATTYAHYPYSPDEIIQEERVTAAFGIPVKIPPFTIDHVISEPSTLNIGDLTFHLSHLPGHSPDSISFHLPDQKQIFAGDALFNGSIGRTDLPGGNHQQLLDSILQNLYTLPDETIVFPGHGPETTIGREKATNPFCPQT